MRGYQHLFFDLDHTLWDHYRNANDTLVEIYHLFEFSRVAKFSIDEFQSTFHKVNYELWHDYHLGVIDQDFIRNQRFRRVLNALGLLDYHSYHSLTREYLFRCPRKSCLMPFATEALSYLKDRYPMSIITNGFSEIQDIKMTNSGLKEYFGQVVTSEQAGWLKPHQEIFQFAMKQAKVPASRCIMVGDNPATDMEGARQAGMDQVYYDPENRNEFSAATYRIESLLQLTELL